MLLPASVGKDSNGKINANQTSNGICFCFLAFLSFRGLPKTVFHHLGILLVVSRKKSSECHPKTYPLLFS